MANRVRSTALIGGVAVVAVLLLIAQRGQAQTVASDRPAGYVVYPKVVVDSSDAAGVGHRTDTLIQLTNTNTDPSICRVVECFYVNATKHCNGAGGLNTFGACRTNADCAPGVTCGIATGTNKDCGKEDNFTFLLSANQAVGWSADKGGFVPPDGNCSQSRQPLSPAPEPFFQGELKCVEVSGTSISPGGPIAANDLKGEASIYEVASGSPGGVDVRAYNAVGIQAVSNTGLAFQVCSDGSGKACTSNSNCTGTGVTCVPTTTLCLGTNGGTCTAGACVGGARSGGTCSVTADCGACTSATHASCPSTLVLNHFFDGPLAPNDSGVINTDLTLVPCSENLAAPPGPSGIKPTVAQFVVFNEFEQRFSASISVGCFKETQLSHIDTLPGHEESSIFNINVQGTLVGQTRIRGVTGADAAVGHGLLGVAEEFVNFDSGFPRGSDAFNLNYVGTNSGKADLVFVP